MEKIEMQVVALSTSESSPSNFVLVLEDMVSKKRIPILIGSSEAQAIAVYMERMQLPRPLTHDLFKNTLTALGAVLKEVVIYDIIDGLFYAWLVVLNHAREEIRIDARASDALALAVRFDCPVYVYTSVLSEAHIQESQDRKSFIKGSLAEYSLEELQALLRDVLAKEDYESASRIRDMINKRSSG